MWEQLKTNKLFENVTSLVSLKGLEYLLNFIMLPYLLRVLGPEKFGAIVFMQGIVQYFVIVVDYGFNMTGPRDIARAEGKGQIGHIFASIMMSKLVMAAAIFVAAAAGAFFISARYAVDWPLFFAVCPVVLGNILFPVWFFQGIQEMRYITIVNIMSRSLVLALLLLLVRSADDYVVAALLQSCMMAMSGFFSFVVIARHHSYVFCWPGWSSVWGTLRDGWHIFISNIAINIYTTTNTVVLGFLAAPVIVGYFGAANKLIDSIKGLMNAITQAVYPYISGMLRESEEKAVRFVKKFARVYCGFFLAVSMSVLVGAGFIIRLLFGNGYDESIFLLRIMAFIPFVISLSNVCGIQVMLNFGRQRAFSKILLTAAAIDFLLVVPLAFYMAAEGVAVAMLAVEVLVTLFTAGYVRFAMNIRPFSW